MFRGKQALHQDRLLLVDEMTHDLEGKLVRALWKRRESQKQKHHEGTQNRLVFRQTVGEGFRGEIVTHGFVRPMEFQRLRRLRQVGGKRRRLVGMTENPPNPVMNGLERGRRGNARKGGNEKGKTA